MGWEETSTLVSFSEKPNAMIRKDKGPRRSISPRDIRKIHRQINSEPNGFSLHFLSKMALVRCPGRPNARLK